MVAAVRGSVPADFVEFRNLRLGPRSLITLSLSLSLSLANDLGLVITGTIGVTDSLGERAIRFADRGVELLWRVDQTRTRPGDDCR